MASDVFKVLYQIRTKDPVDFETCTFTCNLTRVPPWSQRKDLSTRFIDSSIDENLCRQKDYGWNVKILSRNYKEKHSFYICRSFVQIVVELNTDFTSNFCDFEPTFTSFHKYIQSCCQRSQITWAQFFDQLTNFGSIFTK